MRPSWLKISGILTALWLVVGSTLYILDLRRLNPERLVTLAQKHPLTGETPEQRAQAVKEVASGYHRLEFLQRREFLTSDEFRPWWEKLSLAERREFRTLLFPQLQQVVDFFDKFSPEERRRNMMRLMQDARKVGGENILPSMGPKAIETVSAMGIKPLFEGTLLDNNFDMLIMFYELEKRVVWRRR